MEVPDAKRLRQLEDENRALKRGVADQALNIQVLKDVLEKRGDDGAAADCRRYAVESAEVSERRTFRFLGVHRALVRCRQMGCAGRRPRARG